MSDEIKCASSGWLVRKRVAPPGYPLFVYLSHPRGRAWWGGILEAWDERHDARVFTFWEAVWQSIRHPLSRPVKQ